MNPSRNETFQYDLTGRLTQATGAYGTLGFTYDKVGNRTTATRPSGSDSYSYAAGSHRLVDVSGPGVTRTLTYDAAGSLTGDAGAASRTFVYDRATLSPHASLYALLALTAFAMGIRNATVRMLKVPDLSTTVLTLTLTGFASDSPVSGGDGKGGWRRFGAVAAILVGAATGAALILTGSLALPLFVAAAITLLATALYALHPAAGAKAS